MTQHQRAIAERDAARAYRGDDDKWSVLLWELDWEAELSYLLPDEVEP